MAEVLSASLFSAHFHRLGVIHLLNAEMKGWHRRPMPWVRQGGNNITGHTNMTWDLEKGDLSLSLSLSAALFTSPIFCFTSLISLRNTVYILCGWKFLAKPLRRSLPIAGSLVLTAIHDDLRVWLDKIQFFSRVACQECRAVPNQQHIQAHSKQRALTQKAQRTEHGRRFWRTIKPN